MSKKALDKAYNVLEQYVKRMSYGSTFSTNSIRQRLNKVQGLAPSQVGSVISTAVRRGFIYRVGTTVSNDPTHNGGPVGVYERGSGSL